MLNLPREFLAKRIEITDRAAIGEAFEHAHWELWDEDTEDELNMIREDIRRPQV